MRRLLLLGALLAPLPAHANEPLCTEVEDYVESCGCANYQVCVVAGTTGSVLRIYGEDESCGGNIELKYVATHENTIRSNISPYPCLEPSARSSGTLSIIKKGTKQVEVMRNYNYKSIDRYPTLTCTPGSYGGANPGFLGHYNADVEIRVTTGPNAGERHTCFRR